MTMMQQILVLTGKDLRLESRARHALGLILVLGVLIIVVLGLGLGAGGRVTGFGASSILWVAYLFGGVLCFEKTMAVERADDVLSALLVAPVDRGAIFIAKLLTNLLLMAALALVVTPVAIVLFRFDLAGHAWEFALVMALGMIGFAAVGTLFAAIVSSTRLQGGLLAMVVFPLSLPVIITSTQLMRQVYVQEQSLNASGVATLVAFDVIFLIVSWLVFELVLEP